MFRIVIAGIELDLMNSESVALQIHNSAFSDDIYAGDFSWDFNLPLTDKNRRVLGFPEVLEMETVKLVHYGEFYLDHKFYPVKLKILEVTDTLNVMLLLNRIDSKVFDKKLIELNLELDTPYVLNGGDAGANVNAVYPDVPICFPTIENLHFYGEVKDKTEAPEANPQYLFKVNLFDGSAYHQNTYDNNAGVALNANAMVPMPFLFWVLERGFAEMNLKMDGSFYKDANMRKLFLYANYSVEDMQSIGTYNADAQGPGSLSPVALSATFKVDFTTGNNFDLTNDTYEVKSVGKYTFNFKFNQVSGNTPYLTVRFMDGLSTIHEHVITNSNVASNNGLHIVNAEIEFLAGHVGKFIHVCILSKDFSSYSATVTDFNLNVEIDNIALVNQYGTFNGFTKGLPDITFGELLSELKKPPFNLYYQYNYALGTVSLNYRTDLLQLGDCATVSKMAVPLEISYLEDKISIEFNAPKNDNYFNEEIHSLFNQKLVIGKSSSELVAIKSELEDVQKINNGLMPLLLSENNPYISRIDLKGFTDNFNQVGENPDARIAFYQGVRNGIPTATSIYDIDANGYTFDFLNTVNLFTLFCEPWYKKLKGRLFKKQCWLSSAELQELEKHLSIELEKQKFIIDKIEVDVNESSHLEAQLSLRKA